MRIAYTCQDITVAGGLERIMCEKASAMAARGHDVWLIVCNPPGRSPAYAVDPRVHVADVALAPPGSLWQRIGFKIRQHLRIRRILREAAPQVLVAAPTWLTLAAIFSRARLVLESHSARGNIFSNERRSRYKRLKVAIAERRAACVVALTAEESANWRHAKAVAVLPNFCDMPPRPQQPNAGRFMAAGRLSPEKDYDLLVDAWAEVMKKHPDACLDIYGSGPCEQAISEYIGRAGASDNIILHGAAGDMAAIYADHAALVLSSRYEGFGLVLVEAMRCGCAVVAVDCPYGPREIIDHGRTGLLVPYRDLDRGSRVKALAEAICRMIEDPAMRTRMAEAAMTASARYDKAAITGRWEQLFAGVAR